MQNFAKNTFCEKLQNFEKKKKYKILEKKCKNYNIFPQCNNDHNSLSQQSKKKKKIVLLLRELYRIKISPSKHHRFAVG